jgi:hypothetical protein
MALGKEGQRERQARHGQSRGAAGPPFDEPEAIEAPQRRSDGVRPFAHTESNFGFVRVLSPSRKPQHRPQDHRVEVHEASLGAY